MGVKTRSRILFAAFLAALILLGAVLNAKLWSWLSIKTMDELYGLLGWALWAVIIGVIVEEWILFWKGWKFSQLIWLGKYKSAFSKVKQHRGELFENLGFIILSIGLAGELALDPLIEERQKSDQITAASHVAETQNDAAKATNAAARLGVSLDTLNKFVQDRQTQSAQDVASLKASETALDTAIKQANERLAPRDLLGNKLNSFVSLLSRFEGSTIDIWVLSSGDLQESANLGRILFNAFLEAGWNPSLEAGINGVAPGTSVATRKRLDGGETPAELQEKASALLKSLADAELTPYPDIVRNVGDPSGFLIPIRERAGDPSPLILIIGPKRLIP